MNICNYVNNIAEKIMAYGGNSADVFNSNVSDAIIKCFNIMSSYASTKNLKNIPTPFAVVGKNNDGASEDGLNFASLKFSSEDNLDLSLLGQIIHNLGYTDSVNVESFSTCIILEVYVPLAFSNN